MSAESHLRAENGPLFAAGAATEVATSDPAGPAENRTTARSSLRETREQRASRQAAVRSQQTYWATRVKKPLGLDLIAGMVLDRLHAALAPEHPTRYELYEASADLERFASLIRNLNPDGETMCIHYQPLLKKARQKHGRLL